MSFTWPGINANDAPDGYTTWAPRPVDENNGMGTLRIYIDTSNVYPLLRPDISDAERFNGQWFIANTILHEMIASVPSLIRSQCLLLINTDCHLDSMPCGSRDAIPIRCFDHI